MFENEIWDRAKSGGVSTLSRRLYMLLVCASTAAGIFVAATASTFSSSWDLQAMSGWVTLGLVLGVLAVSFVGIWIAQSSSDPMVSLIAYLTFVAAPFGLLLGPLVALYQPDSVLKIFGLTVLVVLALGFIGAALPANLASWGTPLLGALLLLIGGLLVVPVLGAFGVPIEGAMTALDWIGLLIFGALVVYDLNRAARLPHTVDNAVDSGLAVFLDFINIFIRLLSLFGVKK